MKIIVTKIPSKKVDDSLHLKLFLSGQISGKTRFLQTLNRKFIAIGFEREEDAMMFALKSLDTEFLKVLSDHANS